MATEYQREVAALDVAIPASNTADSVNDILLDQIKPRLPASGTISTLVASDVPLTVPTADATTNTNERDVVGNKTDAAVTTVGTTKSIIAYVKGILGKFVPSLVAATTTGVIVEDGTTGTPNIVTVASSASANTFGNWVELDASTSANSWLSSITMYTNSSALQLRCLEIGTGAAASEVTKIRLSSYWVYTSAAGYTPSIVFTLPIPIKIASGTRIAARLSTNASSAISSYIGIQMYQTLET